MRRLPLRRGLPALAAAVALLAACGPAPEETPATGAEARTYSVRGIVQSLPDTGAGRLRIRHEAIPDLVGESGEIEPMDAMTMPFPVAGGADLSGLAVGDAVRFELTVDWQADRPVAVTAIEKLPAGTELALD